MPPFGLLKVQVFKDNEAIPVDKAKITIIPKDDSGQVRAVTTEITDSSGLTKEIEVPAPPFQNSQEPSDKPPYSLCDIKVEGNGFKPILINGCQIYPDVVAIQRCNAISGATREIQDQIINIPPNKLVGNFPPKIPEDPDKQEPKPPSGFVVLPEPVVPQYIVVHAGLPDDSSAPNYTVRYKEYIKNVASSGIFSTWPEATIRANIYCIISFTLNRIYTEWYRGKGKNFDITNSTAFDHAFSYGRNIYQNINRIVEEIFTTYVKRPNKKQPLLTQYCDGVKVTCPNWLTQWGSKYLGDQGKGPFDILTNFYGQNLTITTAQKVAGIPKSYPGYVLKIGSTGQPVRTIQTYLNRISNNYPAIPKTSADGVYGTSTKKAVETFQEIFSLPKIGVVDYPTWYSISDIYVAVTEIAELRESKDSITKTFVPPVLLKSWERYVPTTEYIDD